MNLFVCHETRGPYDHGHDIAYWSWGSDEAIQHWCDTYPERCSLDITRCQVYRTDPAYAVGECCEPHQETRPLVLRSIGWRYEGDLCCDSCGRWELDGLVPTCGECYQCEECGCVCEGAES